MGPVVSICSMVLFGLSLCKNAYYAAYAVGQSQPMHALQALLIGWMTLFSGRIAWLANPLLVMSWSRLFTGRYESAAAWSFAAFVAAASFLLQSQVWLDEAGDIGTITARSAGYWLWLASIGIAVVGSSHGMLKWGARIR